LLRSILHTFLPQGRGSLSYLARGWGEEDVSPWRRGRWTAVELEHNFWLHEHERLLYTRRRFR